MKIMIRIVVALIMLCNMTPFNVSAIENPALYGQFRPTVIGIEQLVYQDQETSVTAKVVKYVPTKSTILSMRDLKHDEQSLMTSSWVYSTGTSNWSGIYPDGFYSILVSKSTSSGQQTFQYFVDLYVYYQNKTQIEGIYAPQYYGIFYDVTLTDFRVVTSNPSGTVPAKASLSWTAKAVIEGYTVVTISGYLIFEFDGDQSRLKWSI